MGRDRKSGSPSDECSDVARGHHCALLTNSAYAQLYNIRKYFGQLYVEKYICALVHSYVDYCNAKYLIGNC